jgi:hypothetical protein
MSQHWSVTRHARLPPCPALRADSGRISPALAGPRWGYPQCPVPGREAVSHPPPSTPPGPAKPCAQGACQPGCNQVPLESRRCSVPRPQTAQAAWIALEPLRLLGRQKLTSEIGPGREEAIPAVIGCADVTVHGSTMALRWACRWSLVQEVRYRVASTTGSGRRCAVPPLDPGRVGQAPDCPRVPYR